MDDFLRCMCSVHGITIDKNKEDDIYYIDFWIKPQHSDGFFERLKTAWKILLNRSALIDEMVLDKKMLRGVKKKIEELEK